MHGWEVGGGGERGMWVKAERGEGPVPAGAQGGTGLWAGGRVGVQDNWERLRQQ